MADDRRTARRSRGPGGRTGPGRSGSGRGVRLPLRGGSGAGAGVRGPRLTGRAVVLVLVLAVLAVSYASSMRAYLHQRAEIAELKAQIDQRQAAIDDLEREKRRWQDPAFVRAQARARIGFVMPGETPFVVVQGGEPLTAEATLTDPAELADDEPRAWWEDAWDSVELAGHPPKDEPPPVTEIDGTENENGRKTE